MTSRARICLIECWLGPYPAWRSIYEASAKANPNLDFVVFTDQVTTARREGNFRWEPISRQQLQSLIDAQASGPKFLDQAWSLTKLKPAYGALFESHLEGYDFWGFHDSDVVWGDTQRFLTTKVLDTYDVITASAAWMVGHFGIFRMGSAAAKPHLCIPDYWNLILQEDHHGVCVDEEILDAGLALLEGEGRIRVLRAQWLLSDGLHPLWKERALENIRLKGLDDHDYIFEDGICRWDGTSLRHERTGKHALYFHFQHWKKNYTAGRAAYSPLVTEYRFCPERIQAARFSRLSGPVLGYWIRHELRHRFLLGLKIAKARVHGLLFPSPRSVNPGV